MTARDDMAVAEYHLIGWGEWRRAESHRRRAGIDQSLQGYRQVGVASILSRILRLLKMQRSRRFVTRSSGIVPP